jgi:Meiotically up-regulated gene 113
MPRQDSWTRTATPGVYRRGRRYMAVISLPGRRQRAKCFGTYNEAVQFKLREQPKARAPGPCRLYLVQRASGGPLKIGTSRSARGRLAALQIGSADELVIADSLICPASWEPLVHNYFADRRVRGEWFDVTPAEVREALALLRRFFRPPRRQADTKHPPNPTTPGDTDVERETAPESRMERDRS